MKKNYIYNLILSVINILFPILSFPYISRILGPYGIGKVQFAITFAQYFALIAALGIPYYGVREISKSRGNYNNLSKTFTELFLIHILSSLAVSILYILVIFSFKKFSSDISYYLYSLLIIFLGFSSIDWFYQGIEEFKKIALRSVIIKILSLISMFYFITKKSDVIAYLCISIFAIIGNSLVNIFMIKGKITLIKKNLNLKKHFLPLIFIFGSNLSIAMYNMLDVIFLGLLSNEESVGYYTASVKIARIAIPIVTSMGVVLLPKITQSFQQENNNYTNLLLKSYRFTLLISVPITFGLYLLAPEMIHLVSGNAFEKAIIPMKILSVLPILIGFGNLFGIQVLISAGKEKEMLKSVALGMIISLLLNFILIPRLNEIGAAIANVLTELVVSIIFYYFVKKVITFKFPIKPFLYSFASCIPFIPVIYLLRILTKNDILTLLFSTLICGFIFFLIQIFVFKDENFKLLTEKIKI
ncbi:flippase [Pelobium sp.]|nr:flippase [Pelobium sp.]MDA9555550.1 flippase [Pelobium sp.]